MNQFLDLEKQVLEDYRKVAGKVLLVNELTAYLGDTDEQGDLHFESPIAVRVLPNQDEHSLLHYNDEWIDPYWDVEIVDNCDKSLRGAYIFGTSYNSATGESHPFRGSLETYSQKCKRHLRKLLGA